MRKRLAIAFLIAAPAAARAQEFHFDGYADFRAIVPPSDESWEDGGLGKTRFGSEDGTLHAELAEVVGQGVLEITPELMVLAAARIDPNEKNFFDVLEGYVRYRPVSTNAWRWSVKAGAFFPPISLENTEVGWTSPWTLTPSAINSWVGEELRTIGSEAKLEWRSEERTIAAIVAVYGWNDPAGVLLADRGWTLDDRTVGLLQEPQIPDVDAEARHLPIPAYTPEFMEIDGRPGWYAGASWDETGWGHLDMLYYNNEADPSKIVSGTIAWRTQFWNAGVRTEIGPVTLLAQGMTGSTLIAPSPSFTSNTDFSSAYLLAGWSISDDWRVAARVDVFSTDQTVTPPSPADSEHGNALTFAVNYLPYDWLRLTAEALEVNSYRAQRLAADLPAHEDETQFQLSARFYVP